MDKKKLVVCALFENAAAWLPEWLAYHTVVGVGHFVLYDNGSTDDPARVIRNLPLAEHVTLIRWPQRPGQSAAYRHFIDIFAPGFEWAAFLGVDEFLLPLSGSGVTAALDCHDDAAAVLVHRRVFAPAPGPWQPAGLAIETHGRRAADDFPANRHVRAIARCNDLLDVTPDPNAFRVNGRVVSTAGKPATNAGVQGQPCYQDLVVNHYCLGAREAWLERICQDCVAAGGASTAPAAILPLLSQQPDDAIQAFAPQVRVLLGLGPRPAVPAAGLAPAPSPPAAPAAPQATPTSPSWQPDVAVRPSEAGDAGAATVPAAIQAAGAPAPATAAPARSATDSPVQAEAAPAPTEPAPPPPAVDQPAMAQPSVDQPTSPQPVVDQPAMAPPAVDQPAMAPASAPGSVPPTTPTAAPAMVPSAAPATAPATAQAGAWLGQAGPVWIASGDDAQERLGGLALVFRDRSHLGEHWLAALRGAAAAGIDPAFLMDDYDRIRDFPNAEEARAACDLAITQENQPAAPAGRNR